MRGTIGQLKFLSRPAKMLLQLGMSIAALLLWMACLLLWQSGAIAPENISEHLLCENLQLAARAVLFITVFAAGMAQEHAT